MHWIPVASNTNFKAEPEACGASWWKPSRDFFFVALKVKTGNLITSLKA